MFYNESDGPTTTVLVLSKKKKGFKCGYKANMRLQQPKFIKSSEYLPDFLV